MIGKRSESQPAEVVCLTNASVPSQMVPFSLLSRKTVQLSRVEAATKHFVVVLQNDVWSAFGWSEAFASFLGLPPITDGGTTALHGLVCIAGSRSCGGLHS